jgi:hypothetical protein
MGAVQGERVKTADKLVVTINLKTVAAAGGDVATLLRQAADEIAGGITESFISHEGRWCGWFETFYGPCDHISHGLGEE